MKRLYLVLSITVMLLLTGCCGKHKWEEATCTTPKRCVKCGQTEGFPLKHDWKEATCTDPRACARCGEISSETLGHMWAERNLEAPKTCTRCGLTEGEKIFFEELVFKKIPAQDLSRLLFRKDTIIGLDYKNWKFYCYDYDENEIAAVDFLQFTGEDCAWTVTSIPPYINDDIYITFQVIDADNVAHIYVFDGYGKELGRIEQKVSIPHGHHLDLIDIGDGRYIRYMDEDSTSKETIVSVDFETMTSVPPKTGTPVETVLKNDEYKSVSNIQYNDKYQLVSKTNGNYIYVHHEYRTESAEFHDATAFSPYGFALASSDGRTYDLFDRDLNVIAKNVTEGTFAAWRGESVFYVVKDGLKHFYSIK